MINRRRSGARGTPAKVNATAGLAASEGVNSASVSDGSHENLLKTSETTRSGDNSVSATTAYTYDLNGNVTSVDGPQPGSADTSYTTYDVRRRPVYEISADPDGAGSLPRKVVKHNYDIDGREHLTQEGTGNATDGSDFVVASFKRIAYDGSTGFPVKTEVGVP